MYSVNSASQVKNGEGTAIQKSPSQMCRCFNKKVSHVTAVARCEKPFVARLQVAEEPVFGVGSSMKNHGNQRTVGRVDQWSHCVEHRYVSSASGTDILTMYCQLR